VSTETSAARASSSTRILIAIILGAIAPNVTPAAVRATQAGHRVQATQAGQPARPLDVARLDAYLRAQVKHHGIPGLAVGVVDGTDVHLQGFGAADGSGHAVTPQTPFVLGSVSKPLTAVAVLQLVDAGQVDLDGPVQRYVPEFRVADADAAARITVRHLLNHTSGLPPTACEIEASTLEQFVASLRTVDLDRPVGARHVYCSGNYNLLGRLIERVSGQPYGAYMESHVFAPLQAAHSFGSQASARGRGVAQGHQWVFGVKVPVDYYNPSGVPAGYLVSSAEDMSRFLVAELDGGRYGATSVLSAPSVVASQAPAVRADGATSYGMGWEVGPLGGVPAVYHYGETYNFEAFVVLEPQNRRAAVVLVNAQALPAIDAFRSLETGVARLLDGQDPGPSSMGVGTVYLIVDVVLLLLLALAVASLVRMGRWSRGMGERRSRGRWKLRVGLRVAAEIGSAVLLVVGVRTLFRQVGARNWYEILRSVPDLVSWVLVFSTVLAVNGVCRAALALRPSRPEATTPGATAR